MENQQSLSVINCAGTSSSRFNHRCPSNPDNFCYVCAQYVGKISKRKITNYIDGLYKVCFGIGISQQDKDWAPHMICNACYSIMTRCSNRGNKSNFKFTTPTIWKEPEDESDCYFCRCNIKGIKKMNKNTIVYPSDTVVQLPCRTLTENPMDDDSRDSCTREIDALDVNVGSEEHSKNEASASEQSDLSYSTDDDSSNEEFVPVGKEKSVQKFDQKQLNDLLRSSGQSKEQAEFIASELKKRNMLEKGTKITFYRNREESFRKYFHKDSDLLYCTDVKGLINELKPNLYKPEEWRLFIDSSMRSLKAVLLHNTNKYAPVPLGHSTVLKEDYSNLEMVLRKIKYAQHQWQICGDLKILSMILGQQSGFTKYPCYLCMFDSRDRASHYKKKIWGPRSSFEPGSSNIVREPLVDPSKILIPPLHIKLGLMKQFVKALDKEGNSFSYLSRKFNHKTDAKLMEGIFDGPEIRMLFRDENFVDAMTDAERAAWLSFKDVSTKFLGNTKDPNYKDIVAEMVQNYQNLGCLMNLKLHFLDSHVDEFPANNGDFSEEHGERFHQDLKEFERRFQGRWDVNMFADYCWMMKREVKKKSGKKRRRNPLHRSFEHKRVRKRKPI